MDEALRRLDAGEGANAGPPPPEAAAADWGEPLAAHALVLDLWRQMALGLARPRGAPPH